MMLCLHWFNDNRHQVDFPQAPLKHLRFEVTDFAEPQLQKKRQSPPVAEKTRVGFPR